MFEDLLGETGGTIAQFALALVVVIALIFLVAWLVKRFGGGRLGLHHGDQANLQVVDTLAIDPKRKLVLVRHGKLEHLLLIGGGSDEVIERSLVNGIPLAVRMQASRAQERQEEESASRPADRFRTNRFASALMRSKAGESPAEGTTADPNATRRAAAGAAAVAAATSLLDKNASATPAKADEQEAASPPPPAAGASDPPKQSEPAAKPSLPQDEREALDRSLDEALSSSLLDEPRSGRPDGTDGLRAQPASPAPRTTAPTPPPPAEPKQDVPESTGGPGLDDLELERELEAALELDAFELSPRDGASDADTSFELPPLPDLPDLGSLADDNETNATATPEPPARDPFAAEKPGQTPSLSQSPPATPKPEDKTAPEPTGTPQPASQEPDPAPAAPVSTPRPAPDIPIALSGRDTSPIPVSIPSRGPAANATTLAKAEEAKQTESSTGTGEASAAAAPSTATPEGTPQTRGKSDDLDDEMRRLLGEIAGETKPQ